MNIPDCGVQSVNEQSLATCPGCHCRRCRRHGKYTRKGFHSRDKAPWITLAIQRYLCLNPECQLCTFSILPPQVMRYCRFLLPDLHAVTQEVHSGVSAAHLAELWHVGERVILRAATLVERLGLWVEGLYRELTDGGPVLALGLMMEVITAKLGHHEVTHRWYRHRYPLRFPTKSGATQFIRLCQ